MLNEEFGALGYLIIALFVVSWIVSVAIYRLNGYDRLEIGKPHNCPRSSGHDTRRERWFYCIALMTFGSTGFGTLCR